MAENRPNGLDPRKLMELAIEVMAQSRAEPRPDGKVSPMVGAVLLKSDGSIDTACRGELRDGDHAEFTLLERKNRDKGLDGSILFATLEPCAPGSRHPPKLGCAERIVLARIGEVWVGVEDPDPTVDRKGIRHLEDHGLKVHMFDRDLQERILAANAEFFAQARKRAKEAEKRAAGPIILSPLEHKIAAASGNDLSDEALSEYRTIAGIEDAIESAAFRRRLALQGVLKEEDSTWAPTGFGLLLFGREPRLHMRQAGLLGTIHLADGREELKDFDGPQVLVPEQAIQWLRDKLPDPVDRSGAHRKPVYGTFFELVREGIVNALVHRDYDIEGAKCQLVGTPEKVTVKSPGGPPAPISLQQLQSFTAPMLSRNPIMHFVFAQMDLAEERGLGLKSMREKAQAVGLPLPTYTWDDPYLSYTIYRSPESVSRDLSPAIRDMLNQDERMAWQFMASRGTAARGELMESLGIDERKAQRILKKLAEVKLIRRVGLGPATRYEVIR